LDLLGEKYGNYAIESELRQVIQDAEKGAKEAPVETKKEETTESNVQEEEKPTQEEEAKS